LEAAREAAVGPAKSPLSLPAELEEQILSLEQWAIANRDEAKIDERRFWQLKVLAIVFSSSAGLIAHYASPLWAEVAGVAAAIVVAIDGLRPRGVLRDTRYRAYSDLRNLQQVIRSEWRTRPLEEADAAAIRRIIRKAEPERVRINNYLRDVEAPKAN